MDATQKAEAEKAEAEKRASERESAALERVVKAEAKLTAHGLGVKPERVAAVIRLSDLSEVEVTDGEPDADALKSAIEATLADYPEFKAASQSVGGSGSKVAGGDPLEKNPWSKEHFNLTEQGRIMEADPVKALRLQQAAG